MSKSIFDNFQKELERQAAEIAYIHEKYCADLLNKHKLLPTRVEMTAALSTDGMQMIHAKLDKMGYKIEHHVTGTDEKGEEIHEWRLYKIYDASPTYRIKRAISYETVPKSKGDNNE